MNINKNVILVLAVALFFHKVYCPYTPYNDIDRFIINRLTAVKDKLVNLQRLLQENVIQDPLQRKVNDFITALPLSRIPVGLIYEFYKEAHILPSKSKEELNSEELTADEKARYHLILSEFSDLVRKIDQSSQQTTLVTFLRDQLENILKQKAEVLIKPVIGRKLQAKINELLQEINDAKYPAEIYRKILESLRVLPILPAREEPLGLTETELQKEKDLLARHAAIMRKIQKKENKSFIREQYVAQLRNAYSKIGRETEEERPLPPLPTEEPQEKERPLPPLPEEETSRPPVEEKEAPQEQPLPEREKTEMPQKEEGTIPPPPPLPGNKEQESQKEEINKSLEERLKEAAEKLKKSKEEAGESQESSKEKSLEDALKKALEERRSSIGEENEEEEEPEEESEWEYNPWE